MLTPDVTRRLRAAPISDDALADLRRKRQLGQRDRRITNSMLDSILARLDATEAERDRLLGEVERLTLVEKGERE